MEKIRSPNMHAKAILKHQISKTAMFICDEPPVIMTNMLIHVGLWHTAIKLNPSCNTGVSKSAWIKS